MVETLHVVEIVQLFDFLRNPHSLEQLEEVFWGKHVFADLVFQVLSMNHWNLVGPLQFVDVLQKLIVVHIDSPSVVFHELPNVGGVLRE